MLAAVLAIATLCLWFRYLPMTDLPQHRAMVSILAHYGDPDYGFRARFVIDLVHRPYASVYLLGALLAQVMPLEAAMRIVIAACTIAPALGAYALLRATGRPRSWALAAAALAFGELWQWGFLNFLAGLGLLQATLALAITSLRRPSWWRRAALAGLALLTFITHIYALAMLVLLAPPLLWAFRPPGLTGRRLALELGWLAPAALLAGSFTLWVWGREPGAGQTLSPGLGVRLQLFVEHLLGAMPRPWPALLAVGLGAIFLATALAGWRAGGPPRPRRQLVVQGAALALAVLLWLLLPLHTPTAKLVSGRQPLMMVLMALPLAPALTGLGRTLARAALVVLVVAATVVAARELARFDAAARSFDPVLAAMQPRRRVAALIFDRDEPGMGSAAYLHFAAYYQAAKGGDISFSFARVWSEPVQYRRGLRPAVPDGIEWHPEGMDDELLRGFDYVLVRALPAPELPPGSRYRVVARSGPWLLAENPDATPDPAR